MNGMEKDFFNRMKELSRRAELSGRPFYTDFLSETEVSELVSMQASFFVPPALFGGAEGCKRKLARFGEDKNDFPIRLLQIKPKNMKFAKELSHRDILGAMLALGVERNTIGDIWVDENNIGYAYCLSRLADFFLEGLTSVGRTDVCCTLLEERLTPIERKIQESAIVSSLRADCILCAAFRLSRKGAIEAFRSELVSLNGRVCTENAKELKSGDSVSLRGKGKFYVGEIGSLTRKGRITLTIEKPI